MVGMTSLMLVGAACLVLLLILVLIIFVLTQRKK